MQFVFITIVLMRYYAQKSTQVHIKRLYNTFAKNLICLHHEGKSFSAQQTEGYVSPKLSVTLGLFTIIELFREQERENGIWTYKRVLPAIYYSTAHVLGSGQVRQVGPILHLNRELLLCPSNSTSHTLSLFFQFDFVIE